VGKMIINFTGVSEQTALKMVSSVVANGRLSKHNYGPCYAFGSSNNRGDYVYATLTRTGTDKFDVVGAPK